ncbi:MAG: hypothetical protein JSS81_22700 [Acidobacteria bacterium]|nr:hypothetical protein [Acidobacteriota bacterium]
MVAGRALKDNFFSLFPDLLGTEIDRCGDSFENRVYDRIGTGSPANSRFYPPKTPKTLNILRVFLVFFVSFVDQKQPFAGLFFHLPAGFAAFSLKNHNSSGFFSFSK